MSLFPGPQEGAKAVMQDFLLRWSFIFQDIGTWLDRQGRALEDWACPPKWKQEETKGQAEYWRLP
ncbi:MAG TPA: hypothetical protein VM286_07160 [Candidatus Thermoplasmatota archaeon]|nr:hypothetical protein [Candidatus Thermoplasmatota archaeon]